MENYEKKYKEALTKAEIYYKQGNDDMKTMMKTCFPELAESEDEKMKKLCISVVKQFAAVCRKDDKYLPEVEKCIAWLEKQGKNNMGISEATKQKLEDNLNKALEKETPESWNEFLEKQREQKPVELNEFTACLKSQLIDAHNSKYLNITDEWVKKLANELLKLAPKKEIQPQIEWSEEDKKRINHIIRFLEDKDRWKDNERAFPIEEDVRWLKSLRPQPRWKPNGDQLDALYDMIRSFKKESSYSNRDDIANVVDTLYEQLKALV